MAALEQHAALLRACHDITVYAALCDELDVPLGVKEALYRIAQEALHNTVKHAWAENVGLMFKQETEGTMLEVRSDGVGFDPLGSFPGHLGPGKPEAGARRALGWYAGGPEQAGSGHPHPGARSYEPLVTRRQV